MDYIQLQRKHDAIKKLNANRYEQHSKRLLTSNISKKFQTTMIGSLSNFEKLFGELWGFGKHPSELSSSELEWYNKWQAVRTEILNNGNNQLRACLDEMAQYTIKWDKYQTKFIVRKDGEYNE